MHRILIILVASFLLGACTMLYTKEYVAEPVQEMTASETEAVFRAFVQFLYTKGLSPIHYGEKEDPNLVAFRISGSSAGFALRRDWEDILELRYSGGNSFDLRLVRIVHHSAEFTDEYLAQFVAKTEEFIREATSKSVRLRLVPENGT